MMFQQAFVYVFLIIFFARIYKAFLHYFLLIILLKILSHTYEIHMYMHIYSTYVQEIFLMI